MAERLRKGYSPVEGINRLGQKVTTEKAARSSIHMASFREGEEVNGQSFDHNNKQNKISKASYDEAAQERVWEMSAGVDGCFKSPKQWSTLGR